MTVIPDRMKINEESLVEVIDAATDQPNTQSADHASHPTGQFVTLRQGQSAAHANGEYTTDSTGQYQTTKHLFRPVDSSLLVDSVKEFARLINGTHMYKVGPIWCNTASLYISIQASSKF